MDVVSDWMVEQLDEASRAGQQGEWLTLVSLLGGDRASCCDEAVAVQVDGYIVGVATIAPYGEQRSGKPTIVGLYVQPSYRRQGHGQRILEAAIARCLERGLVPVHVDILSSGSRKIVARLPLELRSVIVVNDLGDVIDPLL